MKAIIFDCFGVLVTSASIALIHKYPHLETQIEDVIHQADYGLISREELSRLLAEVLKVPVKEMKLLFWNESVRDEDVISWAFELKKSGNYKIGLLSNIGSGILKSFIDSNEQIELFDEIVLSSDVGIAKPEISIFELTAKRLGVHPKDCIMIDDKLLNIDAARNTGMQGIHFISIDQARSELNQLLESNNA